MALAVLGATAYGLNIPYAQLAGEAGVAATTLVLYRVFLMLVLAAGAAWLWRSPLRVEPAERPALLVMALATSVIGAAYLSSVAFIPVTVAVVVFYTFPVLIVLAAPWVDGTPLTLRRLGVVLAAFIGVGLVVGPAIDGLDRRGLALAAVASVCAAGQFFAAARMTSTSTISKVFWVHLAVLAPTLGLCWVTGTLDPPAALLKAPWPVAITTGAFVIAFLAQLMALVRISAGDAGVAFCIEPVVAMIAAVIVLGERLGPVQAVGGALVIAAVAAGALMQHNTNTASRSHP